MKKILDKINNCITARVEQLQKKKKEKRKNIKVTIFGYSDNIHKLFIKAVRCIHVYIYLLTLSNTISQSNFQSISVQIRCGGNFVLSEQ